MGNIFGRVTYVEVNKSYFPAPKATLFFYQNQLDEWLPLEPDTEYRLLYKITHVASGNTIQRVYPIGFKTKPLLALNFNIRVTLIDINVIQVDLENVTYSDPTYDHSIFQITAIARVYDNENSVPFQQAFKGVTGDPIHPLTLGSSYIAQGDWLEVDVTVKDPNRVNVDDVLMQKVTSRVFIPFAPTPVVIYPPPPF